jgi:broad specificity phosphatase PhoE
MVLLLLAPSLAWANDALWALLKKGGQYVLIRHGATDPGVGDPPGFSLADCKTQRNLNAAGRKEAQSVGAAFRARGIPVARVLASPWCRCQETARLAFGGYRSDGTLANLFSYPENRTAQLAAFRKLVAKPPQNGNAVLVTHGATVAAFTGVSPGTGELVIVTPGPDGGKVAGRIPLTE